MGPGTRGCAPQAPTPAGPTLDHSGPADEVLRETLSRITRRVGPGDLLLGRTLRTREGDDLPKVTQHVHGTTGTRTNASGGTFQRSKPPGF